MAGEKEKQDWYLAGRHAITSGFAIPLIISAAYVFTVAPLLGLNNVTPVSAAVGACVSVVSIWLGVKYSAQYIRRFSVHNRERMVNLASLYFVVLFAIFFIPGWLDRSGNMAYLVIDTLGAIASVAVFYYASRRELLE